MSKSASPHHGLLIIDKPGRPSGSQPTSHDVVAMVRRWSGQRRIGHTGTLDPMASGVLVLCLGNATRLVEYYQGHDKQYYAEIQLGSATDTYDAVGDVVRTAPVPELDGAHLEAALAQFRGAISQRPPVYSAIKQQGEALHRKARRGEQVEVEPRSVTIHTLELLSYSANSLSIRVVCSAGAYIRSLANDIGEALGTCAHLSALRREAAGPFTLQDAHTLDEVREMAEVGRLSELLLPLGVGLDLPAVEPSTEQLTRFGYGQEVTLPDSLLQSDHIPDVQPKSNTLMQAITPDGALAGMILCLGPADEAGQSIWRAAKWFLNS